MRILKQDPLLRLFNSYVVDSPQPTNISYLWNFGSLLALCLGVQIVTGVFLVMHYTPHIDLAFNSVEHIMRDVDYGWALRYTHANVASFFFIFVYALFYKFYHYNFWFFFNSYNKTINKFNYFYYINFNYLCFSIKIIIIKLFAFVIKINVLFKKEILEKFINIFRPLCNSLDIININNQNNENVNENSNSNEEFLQWFVGFTDAEGCFLIHTKNYKEVHFIFQITLHIDDSAVLYFIRKNLGIGVISITGNTCSFKVHSFKIIVERLLPIFDKYSLLTHKQLNYRDWKEAILLKKLAKEKNNSIDINILKKIKNIKENMNELRTVFDNYFISINMVSKYWLLGFVEGDGSFHFTNTQAVFSITQKDKQVLEIISTFLQNIKLSPIYNGLILPNKPNCILKNNKGSYQLVITDADVLFQYIYPFFKELQFLSRKGVDFNIWSLGLFLIIHGYYNTPKGKAILLKLSNNMNSKRYFSNINDFLNIEELEALFEITPPFDIFSKKNHFILAKEYHLKKGSRKGYKLYIYKNGKEIIGSPFNNYRSGGKAIGLNSVASIKNYIDTNKIFKDGYTFYSVPFNSFKFN